MLLGFVHVSDSMPLDTTAGSEAEDNMGQKQERTPRPVQAKKSPRWLDKEDWVIRLQHIYNFCLFHAVILSFLDVLQSFYNKFISFFGTNLLT